MPLGDATKSKGISSIGLLLFILVVSRSTDYVLYVRLSHKLGDYSWFFGSIVLGLIFNALSWPVVWYKLRRTNHITDAMRATPASVFVRLGSLDAASSVLGTVAAARVSGPLQVVIAQVIIPCNMLLSWLLLGTRYRGTHFLAVLLVLLGVAIALVPDFRKAAAGDDSGNEFEFVVMLLLAIVPGSASNVFKERALKGAEMDIFYFNAMVNIYQLGFGILTVPMLFSPALMGPNSSVSPSQFPTYVADSVRCVAGYGTSVGQDCAGTPSILLFYIVFNATFNIVLLLVFKLGSATLAVVASALRVALSALGFQWRFLAGIAYTPLTRYDGAALALLLSGLACYRAKDEIPAPKAGAYEAIRDDIDDPPPLLNEPNEPAHHDADSASGQGHEETDGLLAALSASTAATARGEDGSLGGWNPDPEFSPYAGETLGYAADEGPMVVRDYDEL